MAQGHNLGPEPKWAQGQKGGHGPGGAQQTNNEQQTMSKQQTNNTRAGQGRGSKGSKEMDA